MALEVVAVALADSMEDPRLAAQSMAAAEARRCLDLALAAALAALAADPRQVAAGAAAVERKLPAPAPASPAGFQAASAWHSKDMAFSVNSGVRALVAARDRPRLKPLRQRLQANSIPMAILSVPLARVLYPPLPEAARVRALEPRDLRPKALKEPWVFGRRIKVAAARVER